MRRAFVAAVACSAGLVTVAGCGSSGNKPGATGTTATPPTTAPATGTSPSTTAPGGSPGTGSPTTGAAGGSSNGSVKGQGTLELTLAAKQQKIAVVCSQEGPTISASGSAGSYSASMTVKGATLSAVVVQSNPDGTRMIDQAINGLRDAASKPAGKLTVEAAGHTYRGTGTFVVTALDKTGHLVAGKSGSTLAGHFVLDCAAGYAPVPVPPTTSASATTASPAGGTATPTTATPPTTAAPPAGSTAPTTATPPSSK